MPYRMEQQVERELLEELRRAEAAFKSAPPDRKMVAQLNYAAALGRFSRFVMESLSERPSRRLYLA